MNFDGALSSPSPNRLRIAIVPTPRTGNTWLRHLLAAVYSLPSMAVNSPDELDWDALPERCELAIHWHPDPEFAALLEQHEFRVVTMCRHPLDVLISILHFASAGLNAERFTSQWLQGEAGDELLLADATPTSGRFLEYVRGGRARALLAISREWAARGDCLTVPYERLVHDTAAELKRLCDALEPVADASIAAAVAANTLDQLRRGVDNQHHWQGSPGLWKKLLPPGTAREIARAHADVLSAFGYDDRPDESLTDGEAAANWFALEIESLRHDFRQLQILHKARQEMDEELNVAGDRLSGLHNAVRVTYDEFLVVRDELQKITGNVPAGAAAATSQGGAASEDGRRRYGIDSAAKTAVSRELERLRNRLDPAFKEIHAQLADLHVQVHEFQRQIVPLLGIGPRALKLARSVSGLSTRFPKVSAAMRRCLQAFRHRS
jgi:hypothetical protein